MKRRVVIIVGGWAHDAGHLAPLSRFLSRCHDVRVVSPAELLSIARADRLEDKGRASPVSPYALALQSVVSGLDAPFCLAGWSMGAIIAIEAVCKLALRPERMVALAATARFCSGRDSAAGVPPERIRALGLRLAKDAAGTLRGFFSAAAFPRVLPPDVLEDRVAAALSAGADALSHGLDYLRKTDLRDDLECFSIPTLVIHGRHDRIVPFEAGRILSGCLKNNAFLTCKDAGHDVVTDMSDSMLRRISQFLALSKPRYSGARRSPKGAFLSPKIRGKKCGLGGNRRIDDQVHTSGNTVTLVGAPLRAAQGAAAGSIPAAVLSPQPERGAARSAAPPAGPGHSGAGRRWSREGKATLGIAAPATALPHARMPSANVTVFPFVCTKSGSVAARFSAAAATYDRYAVVQEKAADRVSELVAALPPARRALEIGCGTGLLTKRLLEVLPQATIHALDISEGMIEQARARLGDCKRVKWIVSDARRFRTRRRYDLVVSSSALHWVAPIGEVFRAARSLLTDGGHLVFGLMLKGTLGELRASRRRAAAGKPAASTLPTEAEVLSALKRAGFRVLRRWRTALRTRHSSAQCFLGTIHEQGLTGGPFSCGGRPLTRGELQRLASDYERHYGRGDRGVYATYRILYVTAVPGG